MTESQNSRFVDHVILNLLMKATGNVSETRRLLCEAAPSIGPTRYDEVSVHTHRDRLRMTARARIIEATKCDVEFKASRTYGDVKLSEDIEWRSERLCIRNQMLPDTIVQGILGEPVTRLVAHPALSDDMIVTAALRIGNDALDITVSDAMIDPSTLYASAADRFEHVKRSMRRRLRSIPEYVSDYVHVARTQEKEHCLPFKTFVVFFIMLPTALLLGIGMTLIKSGPTGQLFSTLPLGLIAIIWLAAIDLLLNNPGIGVNYLDKNANRLRRARESVGGRTGIRDI